MKLFKPERFLTKISCLDIQKDILNKGIENILLDVDNTILTRDESIVPNDVSKWLSSAKKAGIKICLISNDWHDNVKRAACSLNLPIVVKALKPFPIAFIKALNKIGAKKENTIMIGDQLLTDVVGAHIAGIKCYLVLPLVKKDLKHTLILRKIEKIFLKNIKPENL